MATTQSKKATAKKTSAKKTSANKTSAKKSTAANTSAKNTSAKNTSAKTTSTKQSPAKKVADKKTEIQSKAAAAQSTLRDTISSNFDNAQAFAKQVYLAGLGALGRSVDQAQDRYSRFNDEISSRYTKINKDGQKLVKELVNRGEKVQDEAEELVKESRANIELQIDKAKERLAGMASVVDIPARLQDMSNRLESLSKDLKKSA